jgi:hypothetical protein
MFFLEAQSAAYSITSSARNKIEVGNSMPIALARKSR